MHDLGRVAGSDPIVQQKQKLPHVQFAKSIEENLLFTTRTAQNYLKVIRNKDKVEKENVSLILDADSILKLRGGQCNETENEKEVLEIAIDLAKKLYENESCIQKQFDGFVTNGVS